MTAQLRPPPELMDRVYRRQRHIYDPTRKYFLLGRDHLIAALEPPPGGSVLEIGCGTGRNLIAAARAIRDARFYGLDVSVGDAGDRARQYRARRARRPHHAGARRCRRASIRRRCSAAPRFDRVFFSYSLSMIPRLARGARRRRSRMSTPGGGAAHRRFRPAGAAAALVPGASSRGSRVPRDAARRSAGDPCGAAAEKGGRLRFSPPLSPTTRISPRSCARGDNPTPDAGVALTAVGAEITAGSDGGEQKKDNSNERDVPDERTEQGNACCIEWEVNQPGRKIETSSPFAEGALDGRARGQGRPQLQTPGTSQGNFEGLFPSALRPP